MEDWSTFDSLIEKINSRLANLSFEEIDPVIEDIQKLICQAFELGRSILWLFDKDNPETAVKSNIFDPDGTLFQENIIEISKISPWIFSQIKQGQTLAFNSIHDLPEDARIDAQNLEGLGIRSFFITPIKNRKMIVGALSFCTFTCNIIWHKKLIKRLSIIGQLFSNALMLKYKDEETQERFRFEKLVADISAGFVRLDPDEIDDQIINAQAAICGTLDIELSALWIWSDTSPRFLNLTHLYSPPDGPNPPKNIDLKETFPWSFKQTMEGKPVVIYTEKMPPEANLDKESRRIFGVKSSVGLPLLSGKNSIIGLLSFDALKKEKKWSESIVDRLNLVAQIFTNALARKRQYLMLQESEKKVHLATIGGNVGLWVMDLDSRHVWVNPRTREIFEFRKNESLNYDRFMERILDEDKNQVGRVVDQAIDNKGKFEIEYRIHYSGSEIRWVKATGNVYCNNDGKPNRLMGTTIDITRQKRMEGKLKTQLEEIRKLKDQLQKENIYLQQKIQAQDIHEEIIARSVEMKGILSQVEQVASTDATVLIEGETGTGKEVIARAVHRLSNRKDKPLVIVNCASLPPSLVESELFGREKGAYTGALTKMIGRFEVADGATLFLDEIGEMPMEIQVKLLRVLENGSFERLGTTQTIHADVRIIAATNQNLSKLVAKGRFRKDLYFRLNIFPIKIPPLRERIEDIPPLIWSFVREYEKKMGRRIDNISKKCIDIMQRYQWPGNVRELRNVIERSIIISKSRTLQISIPLQNYDEATNNLTMEEMERRHIIATMERTGWRISGKGSAAELLGLKRTTLQSKMKKLGIHRPAMSAEKSSA